MCVRMCINYELMLRNVIRASGQLANEQAVAVIINVLALFTHVLCLGCSGILVAR